MQAPHKTVTAAYSETITIIRIPCATVNVPYLLYRNPHSVQKSAYFKNKSIEVWRLLPITYDMKFGDHCQLPGDVVSLTLQRAVLRVLALSN
jgi:hypothetical protein